MRSVFLWSYLYVGVEDDGAVDIVIDVVAAAEDGVQKFTDFLEVGGGLWFVLLFCLLSSHGIVLQMVQQGKYDGGIIGY